MQNQIHARQGCALATCAQAQTFLSVSKSTLWRMERAGILAPVRFGASRTIRYRWADLQRLAGVQQQEGGAQ